MAEIRISTRIKSTNPIKQTGVSTEAAFKIARDLMYKWRMNNGFKSPSDPIESYVTVIDTSVCMGHSKELHYEFESIKGKDDNLLYMVERYISAVEESLNEYARIKYYMEINR